MEHSIPNYKDILVIDIETVGTSAQFADLDPRTQELWKKKASTLPNNDDFTPEELFSKRAGIYAEFGKIVCISVGIFTKENDSYGLRIKSFTADSEARLLQDFGSLLASKFEQSQLQLVAHNGKEFDFPYICRRMLVNGVSIPASLSIQNKKPWEIKHIDTMEMWKFGDRKNYTSLDVLANLFGIESSKDDIDGSMVNSVYYDDQDLERISQYCMKDVMVTAQIFLCLSGLPKMEIENIEYL